jgi:5-methylcytosine-specific restriction endonuclease McrA
MNINTLSLARLSDDQLLVRVKELVREERAATAQLLVHLAEMEERRLHCREGCSSLFAYCVEVLHLSEPAAYRRVKAARLANRFPIVLEMVADGSVHLATLDVLAGHLTEANHVALLAEARHKTKRAVEEMAARLRPLPDVPPMVRKLPMPSPLGSAPGAGPAQIETMSGSVRSESIPEPIQPAPEPVRTGIVLSGALIDRRHENGGAPIPDPNPAHRPAVAPLSPSRYRIRFTAGAETYRKLRQVQELLRHQVPDGDPAMIVDKALTVLLEKLLRERTGVVSRPRGKKKPEPKSGEGRRQQPAAGTGEARRSDRSMTGSVGARREPPRKSGSRQAGAQRVAAGKPSESRHIPAEVKRAVWRRDGGRCAFTAKDGRRCSSRGPLEFHHVEPYMLGGKATIGNIALRCRAHNAYEGILVFGKREPRIAEREYRETLPGESSGVPTTGIGGERGARREAPGVSATT